MPRWLLLTVLPFLDGDIEASWNLVLAVGYDDALDDNAIAYFLIQ